MVQRTLTNGLFSMRTHGRHSLVFAVCLWVAAWGAAASQFGDYEPKGFLSDYSSLAPEGDDSKAFLHVDETADFSGYNKVLIDRIQVFLKDDASYKGLDPAELKELVDYFHSAIAEALSDKYPLVDEVGPDVLRLRIAITDLIPNKPEASVVSLVVPFIWAAEAGAGTIEEGEVGSTPYTGEATIELEALDSITSKQLAAYIETRVGSKYSWHKGLDRGVRDYVGAYSTWKYTKDAMDSWANLIRERLDDAHSKP